MQIHELYRLEKNSFRAGISVAIDSIEWRIAIADILCDGSQGKCHQEVRTQLHRLGESSIQASLEELPLLGEQIYQLSIIAALMISPLRHLKLSSIE